MVGNRIIPDKDWFQGKDSDDVFHTRKKVRFSRILENSFSVTKSCFALLIKHTC